VCLERHHDCLMKVEARDVADAAMELIETPLATRRMPIPAGSAFLALR
jgi:hypothetical protein